VSQNWLPWQRPSASVDSHLTHDSLGPSEPTTQTAAQLVQHRRVSLYFTMGCPFLPPQKMQLPIGVSGPHVIRGSVGPPESSIQTASQSVQPFLQGSLV